jgi:hypothetical protein
MLTRAKRDKQQLSVNDIFNRKYSNSCKQVKLNTSMIKKSDIDIKPDKNEINFEKKIKLNTNKIKSSEIDKRNIIDLSNTDTENDFIIDDTEYDITTYMNSIDEESVKNIKDYLSEITPDINEAFFYIPVNGKPRFLMQKFIDVLLIFCPNIKISIKQHDKTLNEISLNWEEGDMNDSIYCYSEIDNDYVTI